MRKKFAVNTVFNSNPDHDELEVVELVPFRTQYNYVQEKPKTYEKPSLTVPDQSLTIREIMQRFAQGRPLNLNNGLVFTGDELAVNLSKLDKVEIEQMRQENRKRIQDLYKDLDQQQIEHILKTQNPTEPTDQPPTPPATPGGAISEPAS